MKKISIFLFLILFSFTFANAKNDLNLTKEELLFLKKNKTLKLHNEDNWPPYNFNENGIPKGFVIDYMNLIAKRLDTKVEYISGYSWNEFMEMLKKDEIDAIINISKNKKREEFFEFTNVYHTAANAIYVKKGNEDIDSLKKLKGKTIVMVKGFFAQQLLEEYYPEIKQVFVKDSLEALRMLSLGKADATIDKKNVLDYLISTRNISEVVATNYVNDDRLISNISIATSKNKPLLKEILNKAQDSISDKELLELKRKWFGTNEIIEKKKFLSSEEKDYIANKDILKICNIIDLKPIEYYEDSKYHGINIDLITKLTEKLEIPFEIKRVNNINMAKEYLKNGICDILPNISEDKKLKDIANFSNPLLSYKLAIVTQKGKPVIQDINEVLDKTMAISSNSINLEIIKKNYPNIHIYKTKTDYETLEAVNSNRVYYAIEPLPVIAYYMSRYALNNIFISRYTDMLLTTNLAVLKDNEILLNILNKTIEQIDENEHKNIFNKWTNLSIKEPFDYTLLWQILSFIIVIIVVLIYRQDILKKHNQKLTIKNNEIAEKTIQIEKQKELFEKLYNKSSDGVLLIKDRKIMDCNEAATKILQYDKEELIDKCLQDISPKLQPDKISSNLKATKKFDEAIKEGISAFEWVHINKNYERFWIEVVLTTIEINNNLVIHTVIRNITKRKEMEKELEILTYTLEERIAEEIKKNQEKTTQLIQQSRFAQMGEMISMIAHQWRQPLAAISATTNNLLLKNILNEDFSKEELKNELNLINDYSKHLSLTIDDFRNFFKTDKLKNETKLEDLIEKSLKIIQKSFEEKNINLIKDYNFNRNIITYTTEIQQVLLIILKNAEDALMEKNLEYKEVKISTYKNSNFMIIKIEDNAGGISSNIIEKIFDPYFSTKKAKEGTGIGLYMSKIIINEHCSGKLNVENSSKGAVFKIKLPMSI
uniref:transporter substrate-binding domain-containing protein n=1 Tax=Aliarcobacter sp. TaxID=2321116 RepID=UPI004048DAC7